MLSLSISQTSCSRNGWELRRNGDFRSSNRSDWIFASSRSNKNHHKSSWYGLRLFLLSYLSLACSPDRKPTLLIYSALGFPQFRHIKLRPRRRTCPACGDEREKIGDISATDYVTFCGGPRPDWVSRGRENEHAAERVTPMVRLETKKLDHCI